ncbi:MAG TPA: glycerophosphodiester phosphodiesterase [Bacilli bacterium]|nr:glycerophosphodiester phosphodiesterase [Bacilli bacterium]
MNEKTEIFAHRGYSTAYPENTMIAFYAAEQLGIDGIELDVQLTKDGQFVVIHDSTLERTTSGMGKVADFTVAQLKELSAGAWFSSYFQDERIPLLEEVLEWAKGNELKINVEMKTTAEQRERMFLKIINMIEGFALDHRLILSSFDHELIYQLSKRLPTVETAAITLGSLHVPEAYLQTLGTKSLHSHFQMLTEESVRKLLKKNYQLRAFNVHSPSDMKRMFSYGVTAIITHCPEMALDLRNQ